MSIINELRLRLTAFTLILYIVYYIIVCIVQLNTAAFCFELILIDYFN